MEKKPIFCSNCKQIVNNTNYEDYWSTASHVPFDTMLKIKRIMKDVSLCKKCLDELIRNNTDE